MDGPVLDLGCGPGRLVAALAEMGTPALGVDASPVAVESARRSGRPCSSVRSSTPLPGEGRWRSVLLFDGNVGIGGDPVGLLRRLAALLAVGGRAMVEVDPPGSPTMTSDARLERADEITDWFPWACVGADELDLVAADAGLRRTEWRSVDGRWFALLRKDALDVIDVVLPVLDEVEAIAWVLPRMPVGYRPIVVDNGSTDGSAELARELGAVVVSEPRRGFGAACFAGLQRPTADIVCFMDCDASHRPRSPPVGRRAGRGGRGRPGARRPAGAEPGAWPLHARIANRWLAGAVGRRHGRGPHRPRPDARRPPGGPARTSASATGGRAGPSRWSWRPAVPVGGSTSARSRTCAEPGAARSPAPSGARSGRWTT